MFACIDIFQKVRIDDKEEAAEYGIESFPAMVSFDKVD